MTDPRINRVSFEEIEEFYELNLEDNTSAINVVLLYNIVTRQFETAGYVPGAGSQGIEDVLSIDNKAITPLYIGDTRYHGTGIAGVFDWSEASKLNISRNVTATSVTSTGVVKAKGNLIVSGTSYIHGDLIIDTGPNSDTWGYDQKFVSGASYFSGNFDHRYGHAEFGDGLTVNGLMYAGSVSALGYISAPIMKRGASHVVTNDRTNAGKELINIWTGTAEDYGDMAAHVSTTLYIIVG